MVKFHNGLILMLSIFLGACIKDSKIEVGPQEAHVLTFNFNAVANSKPLIPTTGWYTNRSKDSLTVTKFNYYISNVKLKRTDGFIYSEPESYHLIRHVEGNVSFKITGMPEGEYNEIEFLIGVDSLRNLSGAQSGDLSPDSLMFWDWEQGYIFFKLEGAFNTVSIPEKQEYAIHIGGFAGPYTCLQKCSFILNKTLSAKKNGRSSITYNVVIDEIFEKPTVIGFDDYYSAVNEKTFRAISVNYKDMFVVDKIEN